MKKWFLPAAIILVLLLLFIVFQLPAERNPDKNPIHKEPEKIVSLAPDLTEILFAIGLGNKIVGVSSDSDWPIETNKITKVGTFWQPNVEAVLATKPDLVIIHDTENHRAAANALRRFGQQILIVRLNRLDDLFKVIKEIGQAANSTQQALVLAEDIESKLNNLKSKYKSQDRPKVMWVLQTEPLRLAGQNTFIHDLIEVAGGQNVVGPTLQQYPSLSGEEVLVGQADVIIQSSMGPDSFELQERAVRQYWQKTFPALPAVKNNRIYLINADLVTRLGPRITDGICNIAHFLHPDNTLKEEAEK